MTEEELLESRWEELVSRLSSSFGEGERLGVDGILYLIGVQELGVLHRVFSKDEKMDLMHISICRLLSAFGYYEYVCTDEDGWPHYRLVRELPALTAGGQALLMKRAIVRYFMEQDFFEDSEKKE
nr:hypothetical protein [uncultured Capnocytophaga sp.]